MPMLACYVTDDTLARFQQEAAERERTVESLAESALEESVRLTVLRAPEPDPESESRERERCKRLGIVNIVNGTCTTCDKPQSECWCVPF